MDSIAWLVAILLAGAVFLWIATLAMATPTVAYRLGRRFDLESPAFVDALRSVLPATVLGGNRIERLDDGSRFYPAMLQAVREARRSIAVECYIFHPGSIGDASARHWPTERSSWRRSAVERALAEAVWLAAGQRWVPYIRGRPRR